MNSVVAQRQQEVNPDICPKATSLCVSFEPMGLSDDFDRIWELFLNKVRAELAKPGETHRTLGARLGLKTGAISKWTNGKTRGTDLRDFLHYMDVLNIRPSDLFPYLPPEGDGKAAAIFLDILREEAKGNDKPVPKTWEFAVERPETLTFDVAVQMAAEIEIPFSELATQTSARLRRERASEREKPTGTHGE